MAFDISMTAGLDASNFESGVKRIESQAESMAQRVSGSIKSQLSGFAALRGAVAQITGAFSLVGVVAGGLVGALNVVSETLDAQRRPTEAQRQEMERVAEAYARAGEQADTYARSIGKTIGLTVEEERALRSARATRMALEAIDETVGAPGAIRSGNPEAERLRSEQREAYREAVDRERELLEMARGRKAAVDAERIAVDMRIEQARLEGDIERQRILIEQKRYDEEVRRIDELAQLNEGAASRLAELENNNHDLRLRQIEEEAAERRRADDEAAERRRLEAVSIGERQQIEAARLAGARALADQLEREARSRETIRRLEQLDGVDDATRRTLIENERALAAQRERVAAIEQRSAGAASSALRVAGLEGRTVFARSDAAQALGAVGAARAARQDRFMDRAGSALDRLARAVDALNAPGGVRLELTGVR